MLRPRKSRVECIKYRIFWHTHSSAISAYCVYVRSIYRVLYFSVALTSCSMISVSMPEWPVSVYTISLWGRP